MFAMLKKQTTNKMANIKERILKELLVQENIEGKSDNIDILRIVVSVINSQNLWTNLVKVKFHKYGVESFKSHRFYYVTDELLSLIKIGFEFPAFHEPQGLLSDENVEEIPNPFDTLNNPTVVINIEGKVCNVSSKYLLELSNTSLNKFTKEEKIKLIKKHPSFKMVDSKEVK